MEEVCPCCGAEREYPYMPAACPLCGWVMQDELAEDEPSPRNQGMTLLEARMNFGVFGSCLLPIDWEPQE